MRKIRVGVVLVIGFVGLASAVASANAQVAPSYARPGRLAVGATVAPIASWVDSGDFFRTSQGGVSIGGTASYRATSVLVVQAELLYAERGLLWWDDFDPGSTRLTYANLPILAKVVADGRYVTGHLYGGPSFNVLLDAVDRPDSGPDVNRNDTRRFELAAVFGAGGGLRLGKSATVTADLRYIRGITDISKGGYGVHNRGFGFVFGLQILMPDGGRR